ncbi:MAG: hypothetical protein QF441_16385 [Bacteriovoracaceae bacterium]|jgi:predicted O-methyltransferase YrrM|nr:hypothetical protein [Halobacteriovoraceae bacterium]MDP7322183.1 hypothetical protein [Bacteriovoracaceae bacterium]|tara:strand:- start:598 stop:1260 length:663 start_codon:yes stop_codon:yes gene_type:complete
MKDYPFSFSTLDEFSNNDPYNSVPAEYTKLLNELNHLKKVLNFPAVEENIGHFFQFFMPILKPQKIFEMGSGYGHSAFWFLLGGQQWIDQIILTEKRNDLKEFYHNLSWPTSWLEKLEYHQDDAFHIIEQVDQLDLALVDGVKANYLDFLNILENKMSSHGLVFIDNSFWRGSFLDEHVVAKKQTAKKIAQLHAFIRESSKWDAVFIPFKDGLTCLRKKN